MTTSNVVPGPHSLYESSLEDNPKSPSRIDFSDAPEFYYEPIPECYYSKDHNSRVFAPEVISGPVLTGEYDGLQLDNSLAEKGGEPKRSCAKKRWAGLIVIIIIIAAAIGGALGITISRKPKDSAQPSISSNTSNTPNPVNGSSGGPHLLSATVLVNTSTATTICHNGDRLLFFQDVLGKLRMAQWAKSSGWAIQPNDTIPSNAMLGTPLSASCENVPSGLPSNIYLSPGRFVSLVYLNDSTKAISQSVFTNGDWSDLPVPQASLLPSPQTKLSLSTNVVSIASQFHLSSLVAYKSENSSLVMIDLISELAVLANKGPFRALQVNPNLLDRLDDSTSAESAHTFDNLPVNSGLACICNHQNEDSSSRLFTQCFEAQQGLQGGTSIAELYWAYNGTNSADKELVISDSAKFRHDVPWDLPHPLDTWNGTSDIASIQLVHGREAIVYLLPNNTIRLQVGSGFQPGDPQAISGDPISPSNLPFIPFNHFSAASAGEKASILYLHYQVNETSLAEISFDVTHGGWSSQPSIINVP